MGLFTARNRQKNPFAERKRREAEQKAAEAETAAILADDDAMEAIAEAEAEPVAVPYDRNAESEEYVQAPDISTFAPGGIVEPRDLIPVAVEPPETETDHYIALPVISPETQAKIDAVVNHAIPPVAEQAEAVRAAVEGATPVETGAMREANEAIKRGRGRPRPQETIERDNAVHTLLVGADADTGISKESIAAELDEKEQQVYSSLRQLSKEGRAENRYVKGHGYRWFAA
jgi:hypothetical protein